MDPDSFEELISCRVCYNIFNEDNRRPRILNCGHSFCHSCLETLFLARPLCPVCKTDVKFTNVGLVPINFIAKDLISAIGLSAKDGDKFKICKASETSNIRKRKSPKRLQSLYSTSKESDLFCQREKKKFSDFQTSSIPKRPPKRIKSYYSRNRKTSESSLLTFTSEQINQITTYCDKHRNKSTVRCVNCEIWICNICATSNHSLCKLLPANEFIDLKKRMFQNIEKQFVANSRLSYKLTKSLNILNVKNKSLLIEIKNREVKFKKNSERIKELETKQSEKVKTSLKLKCLQTLVENSSSEEELFLAKKEVERAINHQKSGASIILQISNTKIKLEKRQSLLTMFRSESVYAVEGNLYGRVSVRKENIWVSRFSSIKPTTKIISFRRLIFSLTRTTNLPQKVFLQLIPQSLSAMPPSLSAMPPSLSAMPPSLSAMPPSRSAMPSSLSAMPPSRSATPPSESGSDIENFDIVIDAIKSSPIATDFVLSCTGLKGESYKGKTLIYSTSSYEMSSEVTSANSLCIFRHHQSYSSTIGVVLGTEKLGSGFRIVLEPSTYQFEYPLGTISSGFQNLKSLRRNVLVKDCGFLI